MTIDVHTVVRDEEAMLPWFLRWYGSFARRIYLYDDGSTDRTREIASAHPLVELREFPGDESWMDQEKLRAFKNACWEGSDASWCVVCDVDEFLYHPDLLGHLAGLQELGITVPNVQGFEMVSDDGLPEDDGRQLWEHVSRGSLSHLYSKRAVFEPSRVDINFFVGCHACDPQGHVVYGGGLALLHYNWLGVDHIKHRWERARARAKPVPGQKAYGWSDRRIEIHHRNLDKRARQVV